MKKILLLSDTHSHVDSSILKYVEQCDQVWHAGDIGNIEVIDTIKKIKPIIAVFGNIDDAKLRIEFPRHQKFMCEDVSVWITHIGGYPRKYPAAIKAELASSKPKIFICGHSHILKVQYDKEFDLLHLNPGACGKSGFHFIRTMLRFTIDGATIKNLEIIELGKR